LQDLTSVYTLILLAMCGNKNELDSWTWDSIALNYFAIITSLGCVGAFPILLAMKLAGERQKERLQPRGGLIFSL
jgi:hypothetical protein